MFSHETLLQIHSLLRLALIVLCAWVFWTGLRGWLGRNGPSLSTKLLVLLATIAADLQLVIGLWMYFATSTVTSSARNDFGAAMKDPTLRYFAVEHAGAMILAVVSVHLGKRGASQAAKLGKDAAGYRSLALWFGLALILILIVSPWPFTSVDRPWLRLGQP